MSNVRRLPGPIADLWDWQRLGLCRGRDSAQFFHPDGERGSSRSRREAKAKAVCRACPVRAECAAHALAVREPYGVWGGFSEAERLRLLAVGWEDLADRHHGRVDVGRLEARLGRPPQVAVPHRSAGGRRRPPRTGQLPDAVDAALVAFASNAVTARRVRATVHDGHGGPLLARRPRRCASRSRRRAPAAPGCSVCVCAGRRRSPAPRRRCSPGRGVPPPATTAARCRSTTVPASVGRLPRAVVDPHLHLRRPRGAAPTPRRPPSTGPAVAPSPGRAACRCATAS